MSGPVLVLFAASALAAFAIPFLRGRVFAKMSWLPGWGWAKSFAAVLLPFLLLIAAGQFAHLQAAGSLRWFALAAALPFLLSRLSMPAPLNGVILLALTVVWTRCLPEAATAPVCFAAVAGLAVWKTAEHLLLSSGPTLEDLLPPLIWLVGLNWLQSAMPATAQASREGLLLGTLAVVLVMRLLQTPFLGVDKLFVKRIVLASSGGLFVLLIIMKLLVAPDLSRLAVLAGGGVFLSYLFQSLHKEEAADYGAVEAVTVLVLIGIFTLVATRLFGTFGLVVLAPTMLLSGRAGFAHAAALFWVARILVQSFVLSYVPNVTGINLTHAYTSAALYAGLLAAMLASLALRDLTDRRWLTAVFLAAGSLSPLAGDYFLHEEPTASFLVAAAVGAVLCAVLAPAMYRQSIPGHESVLLLAVQMVAFALLGNELISLGNQGTAADKLVVLAAGAACLFVLTGLLYFAFSRSAAEPVEVPGD